MLLRALSILVFFSLSAQGSIDVYIVASDKESERQVHFSGTNVDVISDIETESFNLAGDSLKDAINVYFGATPTDAYLKSPTPWGDLYKTHGWTEVSRIFKPVKARMLGVQSEATIVLTQIFNNTSSENATFNAKIQQQVQNTVSSTWTKEGSLNVSQVIQYKFDIKVAAAVTGKTSFVYGSKWGESVDKTETVTVGSESGVEITLAPKQCVIADLYATRGTMRIAVDYEASLTGSAAVNYANGYRGHYFWASDINSIMSAAQLKRTLRSTDTIKLGYYSDSKIVVRDAETSTGNVYDHF